MWLGHVAIIRALSRVSFTSYFAGQKYNYTNYYINIKYPYQNKAAGSELSLSCENVSLQVCLQALPFSKPEMLRKQGNLKWAWSPLSSPEPQWLMVEGTPSLRVWRSPVPPVSQIKMNSPFWESRCRSSSDRNCPLHYLDSVNQPRVAEWTEWKS